jgi:hypothetical protein
MLRRLLLVLTLLSGMCLAIVSSAHAAPPAGISANGPCYWNLCVYEESNQSLTAWSLLDVGPTPYHISIFNQTTGTRLKSCSTGNSCTTSPYIGPPLNQCYTYVAFIGGSGASLPPKPRPADVGHVHEVQRPALTSGGGARRRRRHPGAE